MYNTDNKHNTDFVKALISDAMRQGITEPKEIVEHIAGTYTINGKEIKRDEQRNRNGRRDDQSPHRGKRG